MGIYHCRDGLYSSAHLFSEVALLNFDQLNLNASNKVGHVTEW